MNSLTLALQGGWKVLLAGLLLGAGLPAVFALGVRALAMGVGGDAEVVHARPRSVGKVLAGLCFAVVVAGVGLGILTIVASGFGKVVSYEHIYPVLQDKG